MNEKLHKAPNTVVNFKNEFSLSCDLVKQHFAFQTGLLEEWKSIS